MAMAPVYKRSFSTRMVGRDEEHDEQLGGGEIPSFLDVAASATSAPFSSSSSSSSMGHVAATTVTAGRHCRLPHELADGETEDDNEGDDDEDEGATATRRRPPSARFPFAAFLAALSPAL